MCGRQLCGMDTDVLFAYETPKTVVIRDKRIGLMKCVSCVPCHLAISAFATGCDRESVARGPQELTESLCPSIPLPINPRYTFMFLIAVYIVLFKIVFQSGGMAYETPLGTVRFNLQAPTVDSCDPFDNGCTLRFTPTANLSCVVLVPAAAGSGRGAPIPGSDRRGVAVFPEPDRGFAGSGPALPLCTIASGVAPEADRPPVDIWAPPLLSGSGTATSRTRRTSASSRPTPASTATPWRSARRPRRRSASRRA